MPRSDEPYQMKPLIRIEGLRSFSDKDFQDLQFFARAWLHSCRVVEDEVGVAGEHKFEVDVMDPSLINH